MKAAAPDSPSALIDATGGREVLFFDLAEIERLNHVTRSVCTAQKHPFNPVMDLADKNAWDSGCIAPWAIRGAVYDKADGFFRIWYNGQQYGGGSGGVGIAISRDGVRWERPHVGIYENGGNRDNNIVLDVGWGCILLDEAETDPAKRYKALAFDWIAYSPDGMHWTPYTKVPMELREQQADPVAFIRDDQDPNPQRRFKYVFQYYGSPNKPGPDQVRFKGIAFSPDAIHWQGGEHNPILSPNESFENENHFLAYVPYKGHWLLLYECAWYAPDGTGKYGRYVGDIRLAHSRDGEQFARVCPHQSLIAKGQPQEWDGQFLVITDKAVIKDDTIYLYYAGMGTEWSSWPPQNQAPGTRGIDEKTGKAPTGKYCLRRMGLATLRVDGFTCMHVADEVSLGSFQTRPIALGAPEQTALTANLDRTRPGWSWLEVEALDADGQTVLPGYGRKECGPIASDSVRLPVTWAGRTLAELAGKTIRLRFNLYGATRLYSFHLGAVQPS